MENQADAGRNATLADRLKMAGRVKCLQSYVGIYFVPNLLTVWLSKCFVDLICTHTKPFLLL